MDHLNLWFTDDEDGARPSGASHEDWVRDRIGGGHRYDPVRYALSCLGWIRGVQLGRNLSVWLDRPNVDPDATRSLLGYVHLHYREIKQITLWSRDDGAWSNHFYENGPDLWQTLEFLSSNIPVSGQDVYWRHRITLPVMKPSLRQILDVYIARPEPKHTFVAISETDSLDNSLLFEPVPGDFKIVNIGDATAQRLRLSSSAVHGVRLFATATGAGVIQVNSQYHRALTIQKPIADFIRAAVNGVVYEYQRLILPFTNHVWAVQQVLRAGGTGQLHS